MKTTETTPGLVPLAHDTSSASDVEFEWEEEQGLLPHPAPQLLTHEDLHHDASGLAEAPGGTTDELPGAAEMEDVTTAGGRCREEGSSTTAETEMEDVTTAGGRCREEGSSTTAETERDDVTTAGGRCREEGSSTTAETERDDVTTAGGRCREEGSSTTAETERDDVTTTGGRCREEGSSTTATAETERSDVAATGGRSREGEATARTDEVRGNVAGPTPVSEGVTTRSGRTLRRPAWLKDFVE